MRLFLLTALLLGTVLAETPLRVSMVSLGVRDCARSIPFYRDVLGLTMVGKPGEVALFRAGEITIVLNEPSARNVKGALAGTVEAIFPVASVAESHRDLEARGCSFIAKPHEVTEGTWAATFTDPDGHRLTILGAK